MSVYTEEFTYGGYTFVLESDTQAAVPWWVAYLGKKAWAEATNKELVMKRTMEAVDLAVQRGREGDLKAPEKEKKTEWTINGIKVRVEEQDDSCGYVFYRFMINNSQIFGSHGFEALEFMVKLNKLEREQ